MAINRENGAILWKNSLSPHGFYDKNPITTYANSTVSSDGERIFVSFPNYGLVAYDLDGKMIWEYTHEIISQFHYGGAISPVLADSLVILIINSAQDPRIVALDTHLGDTVWTIRAQKQAWASLGGSATPIVHDDLLIMHQPWAIVAYSLADQNLEWWIHSPTVAVATPVITKNLLCINTWTQGGEAKGRGEFPAFPELLKECDKNANQRIERDEFKEDMKLFERQEIAELPFTSMYFKDDAFFGNFDSNKDEAIEKSEWNLMLEIVAPYLEGHGMLAFPLEGSGERPAKDISWKINEDTPETPSPLIVNQHVFFIKDGGIMTVVERESGKVVHKDRIGAAGGYLSSPMLAGNKIYTCSYNGTVSVLSAEDFSVLAQNKLKEKIGASPVAVDDVLYIRTNKHLYAFHDQ